MRTNGETLSLLLEEQKSLVVRMQKARHAVDIAVTESHRFLQEHMTQEYDDSLPVLVDTIQDFEQARQALGTWDEERGWRSER